MTVTNIKTEWVKITPKEAREILAKNNAGNRPLVPSRITRFAGDMKAARWCNNGETIKFAHNGRLLDGQHRMHAVVESGENVWFLVARGVPEAAFTTIDIGKARTGGDVLAIEGHSPDVAASASVAAKFAQTYKVGAPRLNSGGMKNGAANTMIAKLSNDGVVIFARKNPDVIEAAKFVCEHRKPGTLLSLGQLSWISFETRRIDPDASDIFMLNLIDGAMLGQSDPLRYLREALVQNRTARRKEATDSILAAVVKAWNLRRAGKGGHSHLLRRDWTDFPKFL